MELIIDIETVSGQKNISDLKDALQEHWERKANFLKLEPVEVDNPNLSYFNRAGIYAEFGKIICIGIGFVNREQKQVRIKSYANDNEAQLLADFLELIHKLEKEHKTNVIFCGHNIKEFDLPYICRRLIVSGFALPESLNLSGLKPWQINHQDTLELWRFGDYKHYTSLDLLAQVLDVPSSKTDIDGSEVNTVYWNDNDLNRIAAYCSRDIFTTALVYLRLKQQNVADYEAVYV